MAGIFDFKQGAFDSSEAALLHEAYDIALQGLRATHGIDHTLAARLARSIVKVARTEPDCLRNDGTIDPARLAQRAILRMLQLNAPRLSIEIAGKGKTRLRDRVLRKVATQDAPVVIAASASDSPAKIMLKLFERTPFAKL